MTNQHIGKAIYNSAKLISQVAQETESLFDLIKNRFNTELFETVEKKPPIKIVRGWKNNQGYKAVYDEYDWILNGYAVTLGIKSKKSEAFLWIQLSLLGDENEFEEMNVTEPLLHICLIGHDLSYSDETYININDINDPEYRSKFPITLHQNCFWDWDSDKSEPLKQEWYYSLKLTSLNSVEDVDQKIITPVKSLLSATSSTEKDSAIHNLSMIEGILRYRKVDHNYVAENG